MGDAVIHESLVEVLAAKVRVARSRLDLKDTRIDGEECHVKRAAAEVEHENVLLALRLLVEPVRNRRGGRLVDHALDLQPCDCARVLRRLPLRVVEVGWHLRARPKWCDEGLSTYISARAASRKRHALARARVRARERTVMTACLTSRPRNASAVCFILVRIIAETSSGEKLFFALEMETCGLPLASTISYGSSLRSR